MDRRKFLRTGCAVLAGSVCGFGAPSLLTAVSRSVPDGKPEGAKVKWGMVIDLNKCLPDCDECVTACRTENNVALVGDIRRDLYFIRKIKIKREYPVSSVEKSVLVLCNHCENPPCAQACPVKATYKRDDGIVIVDHHRCIGCRYCMIACPYNARQFNYQENEEWPNKDNIKATHGVPQSCNFCEQRLRKNQMPACFEACRKSGCNAIIFGNLNDPDSDIARLIANNSVRGIREDLGTKPKVFYIGL